MRVIDSGSRGAKSTFLEKIKNFERMLAATPDSPNASVWGMTLENLKRKADEAFELSMEKHLGAGWREEVMLMYPLVDMGDGQTYFQSLAADWNEPEKHIYGPFDSKYDMQEKVEKLVTQKAVDRRLGYGDHDKDFDRVAAIREIVGRMPKGPLGRISPIRQPIRIKGTSPQAITAIKAKLNAGPKAPQATDAAAETETTAV